MDDRTPELAPQAASAPSLPMFLRIGAPPPLRP